MPNLTNYFNDGDEHNKQYRTSGDWKTEKDAEEFFWSFINRFDAFSIFPQVTGTPLYKHHFQEAKNLRADFILFPQKKLIAEGWSGGAIVVEIKRSKIPFGPALSQLNDYMHSSWKIPNGNVNVIPTFGFVFPVEKQHGSKSSMSYRRSE